MLRPHSRIPALALVLAVALCGAAQAQSTDDTALFSTAVAPNVLLQVDNSGSMNHVVWHPAYDPASVSKCDYWDDNQQYFVGPSASDPFPDGPSDFVFQNGLSPPLSSS